MPRLSCSTEASQSRGLDVLRRIRADQRTRRLPVVVLTSSRRTLAHLRSWRPAASSKPVDFDSSRQRASWACTGWCSTKARRLMTPRLANNISRAGPQRAGEQSSVRTARGRGSPWSAQRTPLMTVGKEATWWSRLTATWPARASAICVVSAASARLRTRRGAVPGSRCRFSEEHGRHHGVAFWGRIAGPRRLSGECSRMITRKRSSGLNGESF